jgi:hypothetical protein
MNPADDQVVALCVLVKLHAAAEAAILVDCVSTVTVNVIEWRRVQRQEDRSRGSYLRRICQAALFDIFAIEACHSAPPED